MDGAKGFFRLVTLAFAASIWLVAFVASALCPCPKILQLYGGLMATASFFKTRQPQDRRENDDRYKREMKNQTFSAPEFNCLALS